MSVKLAVLSAEIIYAVRRTFLFWQERYFVSRNNNFRKLFSTCTRQLIFQSSKENNPTSKHQLPYDNWNLGLNYLGTYQSAIKTNVIMRKLFGQANKMTMGV